MTSLLYRHVVNSIQVSAVPVDDLGHGPVADLGALGGAGDPLSLLLQLVDIDDGQARVLQTQEQFGILGIDRNAALEIGRASCRERV